MAKSLEQALDEYARDERASREQTAIRFDRIVSERLAGTEDRLRRAVDATAEGLERVLGSRIDQLRDEVGRRLAELGPEPGRAREQWEAAEGARSRGETESPRAASGGAITERQLEERADAVTAQIEGAMARLDQGMQRVESALGEIRDCERRIVEVYGRLGETEARIVEAARTAERVTDVEERLRSAARVEAEAARRIHEAELRLRDDLQE